MNCGLRANNFLCVIINQKCRRVTNKRLQVGNTRQGELFEHEQESALLAMIAALYQGD
jgi:hypothetical protein